MAASPSLKVFSPFGEYIAAFKYAEHAAVLVATCGNGAEIRYGHSKSHILWHEGHECQSAIESYDFVANTCYDRVRDIHARHYEKVKTGGAKGKKGGDAMFI